MRWQVSSHTSTSLCKEQIKAGVKTKEIPEPSCDPGSLLRRSRETNKSTHHSKSPGKGKRHPGAERSPTLSPPSAAPALSSQLPSYCVL